MILYYKMTISKILSDAVLWEHHVEHSYKYEKYNALIHFSVPIYFSSINKLVVMETYSLINQITVILITHACQRRCIKRNQLIYVGVTKNLQNRYNHGGLECKY